MRHHRSCQVKSGSLKSTTSNPTEFRRINTCVSAAADTVSADGARDSSGGEGIRRRGHTTPHHSARATPQRTSAAGADTSSTDEELRYANMDRPLLTANKRTLRRLQVLARACSLSRHRCACCEQGRSAPNNSHPLQATPDSSFHFHCSPPLRSPYSRTHADRLQRATRKQSAGSARHLRNAVFISNFLCVCPEPVLVNLSSFIQKRKGSGECFVVSPHRVERLSVAHSDATGHKSSRRGSHGLPCLDSECLHAKRGDL